MQVHARISTVDVVQCKLESLCVLDAIGSTEGTTRVHRTPFVVNVKHCRDNQVTLQVPRTRQVRKLVTVQVAKTVEVLEEISHHPGS